MHFTVYRELPDDGDDEAPPPRRFVAFGEDPSMQNQHRVVAEGLRQMATFWPAVTKWQEYDVEDEGETTLEEIVQRFGPIIPIPDEEMRREVERLAIGPDARRDAVEAGAGGPAMFYTRFTDKDQEYVAFGENPDIQNVHRVEEGRLVQTSHIWLVWPLRAAFPNAKTLEQGKISFDELVDRFGAIKALPRRELEAYRKSAVEIEASFERLSAPVELVRVPDEVREIPSLTDAQLAEKAVDVALRVEALSGAERIRYVNFRNNDLMGRPGPSARRWIEAAVSALHDVERLRDRVR